MANICIMMQKKSDKWQKIIGGGGGKLTKILHFLDFRDNGGLIFQTFFRKIRNLYKIISEESFLKKVF